jgi:hypothetical protein
MISRKEYAVNKGLEKHVELTEKIIAACYEVHKILGPGLHRVDLVVEDKVLVELKAVTGQLSTTFVAQTISERKVSRLPVALLVNFGEVSLQIRRLESRD